MLAGQRIVLFVAWLAWSRFRVVVPLRDRTMPSVILKMRCVTPIVDRKGEGPNAVVEAHVRNEGFVGARTS
jgi:hypothetical protein